MLDIICACPLASDTPSLRCDKLATLRNRISEISSLWHRSVRGERFSARISTPLHNSPSRLNPSLQPHKAHSHFTPRGLLNSRQVLFTQRMEGANLAVKLDASFPIVMPSASRPIPLESTALGRRRWPLTELFFSLFSLFSPCQK